jgi:hypothetical protein
MEGYGEHHWINATGCHKPRSGKAVAHRPPWRSDRMAGGWRVENATAQANPDPPFPCGQLGTQRRGPLGLGRLPGQGGLPAAGDVTDQSDRGGLVDA